MSKGAKEFLGQLNTDKVFADNYFAANGESAKEKFLEDNGYQFNQSDILKEIPLEPHVLNALSPLGCDACANGWHW